MPSLTVSLSTGTPSLSAAIATSRRRASAAAKRRVSPPRSMPVLPLAPPWLTVRRGVAHHHRDPLDRQVELVGDDLGDADIGALAAVDLAEEGDGRAVLARPR